MGHFDKGGWGVQSGLWGDQMAPLGWRAERGAERRPGDREGLLGEPLCSPCPGPPGLLMASLPSPHPRDKERPGVVWAST